MEFFIDTAEIAILRELHPTGMIDGVTTNPTLIAKSGRKMAEVIAEICALVPGSVSAEVVASDAEGMVREGEYLAAIAPNVTVKVPLTWEGLKATRYLSDKGLVPLTEAERRQVAGQARSLAALQLHAGH